MKLTDDRIEVNGLPWFREDHPLLARLPRRMKEQFREPVWTLALCPSGGRLRFRTDSIAVALLAKTEFPEMGHIPLTGSAGFDLYVDGSYAGTALCSREGPMRYPHHEEPWRTGRERRMREVSIYLPTYSPATVDEVVLDNGARVEPPAPYRIPRPVVYYGSSITQGGCASNPGGAYPALLERRLGADFVNLGFSGNGLGDFPVAEAMAEISASCIVLDYWGNPSPAVFRDTLPGFVGILSGKLPLVPILVAGPYYFPRNDTIEEDALKFEARRRIADEFVRERRAAGDRHIAFVDGLDLLSREQAHGLVDGVHANSLGFHFIADGLEPHLRRALGESPA